MRNHSVATSLWLSLCLLFSGIGQVQAEGVDDVLFKQLKGAIVSSVPPDAIEMARFSIAHPSEAATIYSRAAAQDYPFFALVGAAKAAKDRDFLGIGKFTVAKCMAPISAIDSVFSKAESTISDGQGKANTNAAMSTASAIAADYAKAQSAEAKKQLTEKLAQTVPYFGDIGTICMFAFETSFQAERDLNQLVDQTSQDIRSAYFAFKSGDVLTGTEILLTLGAGKAVVCGMVDNAVAGGAIGRTPLLGDLAKGACAGFVGTVIDGVTGLVKGGVAAVEAGVGAVGSAGKAAFCAVYSLVGNGCSSSEPPPTAMSNAGSWCAARGGVGSLLSKTNHPDDYSVICNDGSQCSVKPGHASCATAAEIAANKAQELANADAEFQTKLPKWQAEFSARWTAMCPDASCAAGINAIRADATQLAKAAHAERPRDYFMMVTYFIFEAADRHAVAIIEDYRYRLLPGQWAAAFAAHGNEACEDEVCRTAMKLVSLNTMLQVQQRAAATPRPPYATTVSLYAAAEKQAATIGSEAAARAVEFNKKTTADAGVAWEIITNAVWGKKCADTACVSEVKKLSGQMRVAANLVQLAHPEQSSLAVQGTVGTEYGIKFKAAVSASQERAARQLPAVPAPVARAPGPLKPLMQRVRFTVPQADFGKGGRPMPVLQPAMPAAQPVQLIKTPGRMLSIQAGTDRMGSDYRSIALDRADPQLCRQACADDNACRSYTYVNPGLKGPKAMCFLKNAVPPPSPNACCTSGEVVGDMRR